MIPTVVIRIAFPEPKINLALDFATYLESSKDDLQVFVRNEGSYSIGEDYGGLITLLLGATGSLASIVSLIWMAFKKFRSAKNVNTTESKSSISAESTNFKKCKLRLRIESSENKTITIDSNLTKSSFTQQLIKEVKRVRRSGEANRYYEQFTLEVSVQKKWHKYK